MTMPTDKIYTKCRNGKIVKTEQAPQGCQHRHCVDASGSVPHLWRISDGEQWTRQQNGKYTMDSSEMATPWEYTFGELMRTNSFTSQNVKVNHE